MSARNRERRKAKASQKAREHQRRAQDRRESGQTGQSASHTGIAAALILNTLQAMRHDLPDEVERCLKLLTEGPDHPRGQHIVNRAVLAFVSTELHSAWAHGWQPADLVRIVDRRYGPRHARMAVDFIAAQMRQYAVATVDPRWQAQLQALDADVWWAGDELYLDQWGDQERLERSAVIRCAAEVAYEIAVVPVIPTLCPPPGTARPGTAQPGPSGPGPAVDQRKLDLVRALLKKAESTEFPEEAEAFTAKAQELMARHSIDDALLAADNGTPDTPSGIRLGVDNPYEAAKALLLQNVAAANRCQTMWFKPWGFSTVLGFPADLDAVEMLYTSLLVQATTAVVQAGSRQDGYGRSRTRSFRQSFLNAYAIRIGQRLQGATEHASQEAGVVEGNERLLPVLAARDDAVREAAEAMFPDATKHAVRINDREGWASGTAAADRASLHGRRQVPDGG